MGLKSMAGRLFSKDKDVSDAPQTVDSTVTEPVNSVSLSAPLAGTVLKLENVSDQTFACGALGPGAAVEPINGKLVAPADGKITIAFPTGHAIGIRTEEGLEILIHVGFDTVELDGKFFNPVVTKGQEVKRGDVLVEFDLEEIKKAGYPLTTPLVVTNAKSAVISSELASTLKSGETISAGDSFLELQVRSS